MERENPLLQMEGLPPFSRIQPEDVEPAITALLQQNRQQVEEVLQRPIDWEGLIAPLEQMEDRLNRVWAPVSHLNAVRNSPELREAYNRMLPLLSDYASEMGQHRGLYEGYRQIADSRQYAMLEPSQQRIIKNGLRDFHLSGIDLPPSQQTRFREINQQLSMLNSRFSENVLDATNRWTRRFDSPEPLAGLPQSALAMARQSAEERGEEGWMLTLEYPAYLAVMTYAEDRDLREACYTAYVTRASDQGPHDRALDNTPVMLEILRLRQEKAALLGYANYSDYSLATKMAERSEQVVAFLEDLAARSLPVARQELNELRQFAADQGGIEELQAWDIAFYSERLKQQRYQLSQEELKPWFPIDRVLQGMFTVVERLYGITIREESEFDRWHSQVRFFSIIDQQGGLQGQFYTDLYARSDKRGGAWMDDCITRSRLENGVQIPVAWLVCNFTPPLGEQPALLTHDEVLTLFHEFGHGLHHLLTQVDFPSVSGIGGVPWDAVELPSQFMENWCWQQEVIPLISGHFQSGEPLPRYHFEQLLESRYFQSGMAMVRQLEFALFDFRLHLEFDPEQGVEQVYRELQRVRDEVAVMEPPSFNRFPHSFTHIFSGGYAAGYYSYKWAEVLSADAFSSFEEHGIFDRETGLRFLTSILEQGGARDPMELFIQFRGREPEIDALLRHSGIQMAAG